MKQNNKKRLNVCLIATLAVVLGVFIMPCRASTQIEWTSNSSLIKSQDKWDCRLWHWNNIGLLDPAEPDEHNYCTWTADGTVNLRVEDSPWDTYFTAANLDQGTERFSIPASYQPDLLRLASWDKVTLDADVENCHGSSLVVFPDFIGIKFDAWAVVDQNEGSTKLMTELYFLRAGSNLAWPSLKEYARQTVDGSDVWNYLVALDHPDFYGIYANETKYGTDSAKWSIDLKYFIKRGADAHNIEFNKLNLSKVSFTLEAGGNLQYNACWGTIHMLKVTYSPYTLTILTPTGGTTDPAPGTYTYQYGSSVTVTATANAHYAFDYWVLHGATISGNPITVTMDSDHSLEARFKWVNSPPNTPLQPSGLACECPGVSHGYSTCTTDPDGDLIEYYFYWGDGSITGIGWYQSGATSTAYYAWQSVGTYYVRVRAVDSNGAWSDWSPPLKVVIQYPPNTPSTPSGPTTVYRNVWYTYSTSATDPEGDRIRYHLNVTGPGRPYENTTIWVDSGTSMSWNLLWEPTDSPGTYLIQTWVEDAYGALSSMSSLSVNMINRPPNNPATPSGPTNGYRGTSYDYSTSATDPDGDNVCYQFDWGDGTTTTGWYSSDATAYASHAWSSPGWYNVSVRTQDIYGEWSAWSPSLTVTIYDRAPNTPSTPSGPTDGISYRSYTYYTSTTDPDGDDVRYQFDWGDGTTTMTGWYVSGATVSASHTWELCGWFYVKVRVQDSYGALSAWSQSLVVSIHGGAGTCPTLFVWDGSSYVNHGVIDIHNPSGEDVVKEVPISAEDVGINNHMAKFRLREGWPGLNFSESFIDQVKLYVLDSYGNRYLCSLISAEHSRLGNVLPQLLLSDNRKAQTLLLETIDLTFVVPCPNIQSFTFVIEGCNPIKV